MEVRKIQELFPQRPDRVGGPDPGPRSPVDSSVPHAERYSNAVSSGVEHGNLRELAFARMKDLGIQCHDVRTREVGIQEINHKVRPYQVELVRRDYVANGGWETFLSYEDPDQDILIGLLRLRKCSEETFRFELVGGVSIVRELFDLEQIPQLS